MYCNDVLCCLSSVALCAIIYPSLLSLPTISHRHRNLNLASFAPATIARNSSEAVVADDHGCEPVCSGEFLASHGPDHLHMLWREKVAGPRWSAETVQWYVEDRHTLIDVRDQLPYNLA